MFTKRNSPQRFLILVLLATGALAVTACSRSDPNSEPTPVLSAPPQTTFPMPPIGLVGSNAELGWVLTDGTRAKLSEYKGKVLVLDLYATWCEPCRESIPHLIELQRRYEEKGLILIGLNVGGPDDRVKVQGFAAEFHITYPLGFPDQALMDLLLADNSGIPQTYVFSREGKLLDRFIGYDDTMPEQLEQVIRTELLTDSK